MEVWSDQPGLQLYSGQWLDGIEIGKCGRRLERYSSFTFETQNYPDAPNKKLFQILSCILKNSIRTYANIDFP